MVCCRNSFCVHGVSRPRGIQSRIINRGQNRLGNFFLSLNLRLELVRKGLNGTGWDPNHGLASLTFQSGSADHLER